MCCRVLLVVIVLTCTFQSEIKAESDDVVCVLLLSGLQKDDLDGTLLMKLQKHNVNIDEMYEKETIEKCVMKAISEMPKSDMSTLTEKLLPKHGDTYDETSPPMDNKIHNVTQTTKPTQKIYDKDGNVNLTNITYSNKRQITNNNSVLFSIENIMNLYKMINTAKPLEENQTVVISEKHLIVDMPINSIKNTVNKRDPKEFDYIDKVVYNSNATKRTETTKHIHNIISQQIQKFLDNNNNNYTNLINRLSELNSNTSILNPYQDERQARKNFSMKYINDLLNERDNYKNIDLSESRLKYPYDTQVHTVKSYEKPLADNIIKEITKQVKETLLKDLKKQFASTTLGTTTEEPTTVKSSTTHTHAYISRNKNESDIFEKIKLLFQELNKETTERQTETTTEIASTTTVFQIAHDSIKNGTNDLESFMELFKQFKKVRDIETAALKNEMATKKTKSNQTQGTPRAVYPPFLPLNYPPHFLKPATLLPIITNHYSNFLQMSHPIVEKTNTFQQVQQERYTIKRPFDAMKLSNFYQIPVNNPNNNFEELHVIRVPSIIQTDAIEVPPLRIPVSKAVNLMNTNIIVTTQHPMVQIRDEYQHHNTKDPSRYLDYLIHSEGKNNGRSDTEMVKTSDIDPNMKYHRDMERDFDLGNVYAHHGILPPSHRLPRIRQSSDFDHFYRDYISKLKEQDPHTWNQNRDNYHHDKPERPSEWQRDVRGHDWDLEGPDLWQREIREREKKSQRPDLWQKDYRNDKRSERPRHIRVREKTRESNNRQKVASRQQLSIHDMKKKPKYDDTHYKNFLKTQQRVNDMLEKILATRGPDRTRSVESPDIVHAYIN